MFYKRALVTGGSGFFGGILERRLIADGWSVLNVDLVADDFQHNNHAYVQGDIRNIDLLNTIFSENRFDCVFHCAAILAHAVNDKKFLWESNVDGTRNIAESAVTYGVKQLVFTSSNCLWAKNFHRLIYEDDTPDPVEIYGKSKFEGENVLLKLREKINSVIIRCPTIIDEGRLGLLGILFEFIDEGRKIWTVGGGHNVYQFIYAQDLVDACVKASGYPHADVFNIGSDNVKPFRDVYKLVIKKAGTNSSVATLPKKITLLIMKAAYILHLSPLGPYQYKMIAEDFVFDTSKIKNKLHWQPTLSNEEMLYKAYRYYRENIKEIKERKNVSAHRQTAKLGIIRLLKWIS